METLFCLKEVANDERGGQGALQAQAAEGKGDPRQGEDIGIILLFRGKEGASKSLLLVPTPFPLFPPFNVFFSYSSLPRL